MKIKLNPKIFYGNLLKVSTNHYTFVNCLSRSIENSAEHILRYRSSQDISSKFACGFLCINTTCSFKHLNNSFGASDFKYLIKWVYFIITRLSFNFFAVGRHPILHRNQYAYLASSMASIGQL